LKYKWGEKMDSIIGRIIELDQQALNIKEKIKEMEKSNSEKLKKVLDDLEDKTIEEAKKVGKEKYKVFIDEGEVQKEKIGSEAEKECKILESAFREQFEALEKSIFNEIFKA